VKRPPSDPRDGATAWTPRPTPVCPKCNRGDRVQIDDQSGSSAQWYLCEACGNRFIVPTTRSK